MAVNKKFFVLNIVWRKEYLLGALILIVYGFLYGLTSSNKLIKTTNLLPSAISGKTIVIDAGHGGGDPGAIGRTGLKEKDITLDLAKRLKRYFSRVGVYVVMIRELDLDYSGENGTSYLTKKRRDLL
ncbi:MAG TPA: hypothetical protein DDW93_12075, partial [Firmicutes bacterium]|nr:hypothetical protein [Bacillota bacterium]